MTIQGKKKNYRVGENANFKMDDFTTEHGDANVYGLLRTFVRRGSPKWGSASFTSGPAAAPVAVAPSGKVAGLKGANKVTLNEPGRHTIVLVYFDQGPHNKWRFVAVATEEILASP